MLALLEVYAADTGPLTDFAANSLHLALHSLIKLKLYVCKPGVTKVLYHTKNRLKRKAARGIKVILNGENNKSMQYDFTMLL